MEKARTASDSRKVVRRVLGRLTAATLLCLLLLYGSLRLLIPAPFVADRLSRLLSDYLHERAAIGGLHLDGMGVRVTGVSVANPVGFGPGTMLSVRTITVRPEWGALIRREKRFRVLALDGVRLNLEKDRTGAWNLGRLRHLVAGKRPSGETFIRRLTMSDAIIRVDGRALERVDLTMHDLATRGTETGGFTLSARDSAGNPYEAEGTVRLGASPDADITFRAPDLRLGVFAPLLRPGTPLALDHGRGSAEISARLRGEELALRATAAAQDLHVKAFGERLPVRAALDLRGSYSLDRDEAHLGEAHLVVNDRVHLRGGGLLRGVKGGERRYEASLKLDPLPVGEIVRLLPRRLRRDLSVTHGSAAAEFHLAGNERSGVTAGTGRLRLADVSVRRGGTLVCSGAGADLLLTRQAGGWQLAGKVERPTGGSAGGLVESLSLPMQVSLSPRLRPVAAEVSALSLGLFGVRLGGALRYTRAAPLPWEVRLLLPETPAPRLARFLSAGAALSGGTVTAQLEASGKTLRELTGEGRVRLDRLAGSIGDRRLLLERGDVSASLTGTAGSREVRGTFDLRGGSYVSRRCSAAGSYALGAAGYRVENGSFLFERTTVRFASLRGPLPRRDTAGRMPFAADFAGGELASGDLRLGGLSGTLALTRAMAAGGSRFQGNGSASAGSVAFRGAPLGPASLGLLLDGGRGTAQLSATPLGGRLAATLAFDPAAPAKGGSFTATATALDAGRLWGLLGARSPWRLAAGTLTGTATGSYGKSSGPEGEIKLQGESLAVTGPGGKQAFAGARGRLRAGLAGSNLRLAECAFTSASGLRLEGRGELAQAFGPQRRGSFSYTVAATPLATLLDDFANLLPPVLQEATAAGTFALRGKGTVEGRNAVLDGTLTLAGAGLDVTAHRLNLAGVDGTLPFSFDLSGRATAVRRDMLTFSRDNYPLLLDRMTREARTAVGLTIGRFRFGPLETGDARLAFRAGGGVTELTSLSVPFYGGTILGRGSFLLAGGPRYSADLLVTDVSLREICNAFVAIRGYLSGRIDGVVSLQGTRGGVAGLKGFTDLWARSGKGEKMLVSREFLQKLAGKSLRGFLFGNDRSYDRAEVAAYLEDGYLTFSVLDISHTNLLGVRDLSVSVAPVSNRIALDHFLASIREAAARGKAKAGEKPAAAPPQTEFKWEE
jgi:hypothetical protein